jgi:hypothetical protein
VQIVVQPQQNPSGLIQVSTLQATEQGAPQTHLQQTQPTAVIASTLVAQPSGDHASEVIALQQQIAVLQAQQQAQAVAAHAAAAQAAAAQVAVAAAAQAQVVAVQAGHQPPVTVQMVPAIHRAASHGVLYMEGGVGQLHSVEGAGANLPAESIMMSLQNGPQTTGLTPVSTEVAVERTVDGATAHVANAGVFSVPECFMEGFLQSQHAFMMDPESGSAAALMDPIVSIPETAGTNAANGAQTAPVPLS